MIAVPLLSALLGRAAFSRCDFSWRAFACAGIFSAVALGQSPAWAQYRQPYIQNYQQGHTQQYQQGWTPPPQTSQQDLHAIAHQWVEGALHTQPRDPAAPPLRMEFELGRLDPRLQLGACAQIEPYLPLGSRLWGRTRVGLRCTSGPTPWNVFLPVTVRAMGPGWVLVGNVNTNQTLDTSHAVQDEVDWAAESSPIVARAEDWLGHTPAHPLRTGQALRQSMLKPPTIFRTGATVKVVVQGGGFAVSASGRAMGDGFVGAQVRVRMDSGRFVSGTVSASGEVIVRQ